MNPEDVVRLKQILKYDFVLDNLKVITKDHKKLGKVEDYLLDPSNFMIRQLLVKPKLTERFSTTQYTITRQQIEEINNDKIVVK